jgi:hypothetical protein
MKALKRLIQTILGGIFTLSLMDLSYHYFENDWKMFIGDVISIIWIVAFTLMLIRMLIELHRQKHKNST